MIDAWTTAAGITDAAGITEGTAFRAINKHGHAWGDGLTAKVLWDVVRAAAKRADIDKLAPHDLRRTCARLRHMAGGELDLGCKQKLRHAVNDRLGIEPDAA